MAASPSSSDTMSNSSSTPLTSMPSVANMSVEGYHKCIWRIYIKNLNQSESSTVSSEVFSVGKSKWKICAYPNGVNAGVQGYLSLFLCSVNSTEKPFTTSFSMSVISHDEKRNRVPDPKFTFKKQIKDHVFRANNQEQVGWEAFMTHAQLKEPMKLFFVENILEVELEIHCNWGAIHKNDAEEVDVDDDEEVDGGDDDEEESDGEDNDDDMDDDGEDD